LTIKSVRETIEPANSREGSTPNALGATAKLKKHAAPSHNAVNKARKSLIKFIDLHFSNSVLLCRFSAKKTKESKEFIEFVGSSLSSLS
jgi:hypothetical protein